MSAAMSTVARGRPEVIIEGRDERPLTSLGSVLLGTATVLAVSGLVELLGQRIVYRVGMHIPRHGAFLEAYRLATFIGDFAFRTTAILLAISAGLALIWLWGKGQYVVAGFLAALMTANLLAWPLRLPAGVDLAPLILAFAAAWTVGQTLTKQGPWNRLSLAAAGTAVVLAQYGSQVTGFGDDSGAIPVLQLASELALVAAAMFFALAALERPLSRRALAASGFLTLALAASFYREPSTVAIVSLWATGVTMSLPGLVYIGAFGAVVFAGWSWSNTRSTRHLAVGLALLMVAGLHPQALHHGITALLGLTLLSVAPGKFEEPLSGGGQR
jgi:hypothetical protein